MDQEKTILQEALLSAYNREDSKNGGSVILDKALQDLKLGRLFLVEEQMTCADIFSLSTFLDTKQALRYLKTLYFGASNAITGSSSVGKTRDHAKQKISEFLENKPKLIKALARFLSQSTGLVSIFIESQYWTEPLVSAFAIALASSKSRLRWLSLKNFNLGDTFFKKINKKLVDSPLQFLGLEACRLTDESAKLLVAIVKAHEAKLDSQYWNASLRTSTCTCLNCRETDRVVLGSGGGGLLHMQSTLHHLDSAAGLSAVNVAGNCFTDYAIDIIATALSGNYWIKGINLGGNRVSSLGIFAFFRELSTNESLTAVIFYGNPGYEEAMCHVHSFKNKFDRVGSNADQSYVDGASANFNSSTRKKGVSKLLDESARLQINEHAMVKVDAVPDRIASLLHKWVVVELEQMAAVTGVSLKDRKKQNASIVNGSVASMQDESLKADFAVFEQPSEVYEAFGHPFGANGQEYEHIIRGTDDGTFDGIGLTGHSDLSFGDVAISFGPPVTLPSSSRSQLDRPPSRMSIRPRHGESFLSEEMSLSHPSISTAVAGKSVPVSDSADRNREFGRDVATSISAQSLRASSSRAVAPSFATPDPNPPFTNAGVPASRYISRDDNNGLPRKKSSIVPYNPASLPRPKSASVARSTRSKTETQARKAGLERSLPRPHTSQGREAAAPFELGSGLAAKKGGAASSARSAIPAAAKKKKKKKNDGASKMYAPEAAVAASTRMRLRRHRGGVSPDHAGSDGIDERGNIVYPDSLYNEFFSPDVSGAGGLSRTMASFSQAMETISGNLRVACESLSRLQAHGPGNASFPSGHVTAGRGSVSVENSRLAQPQADVDNDTAAGRHDQHQDEIVVDSARMTELIRKSLREKLLGVLKEERASLV